MMPLLPPEDAWVSEAMERYRDVPSGTPFTFVRYRKLELEGLSDFLETRVAVESVTIHIPRPEVMW